LVSQARNAAAGLAILVIMAILIGASTLVAHN